MKKFAMAAVAVAAMAVGGAHAYTMGTYTNGVVVPNVIHNGPTDTTAVGLINRSGATVSVFWTFFDQDSGHVTDGCFPMTNNDYQPFVWSTMSGLGLEGQRGYLVFAISALAIDAANPACSAAAAAAGIRAAGPAARLSANAFQVDTTASDVSYIPVIDGPLNMGGAPLDLSTLGADSIIGVGGAAQVPGDGNRMLMRYAIDNTADGGDETRIVVWSTGDHSGTHTVDMYDDAQGRKSVNFALTHSELDWFNPEAIPGRVATSTDGFIEWRPNVLPAGAPALPTVRLADGGSAFTYSVISSPAFGAIQTVLGSHHTTP